MKTYISAVILAGALAMGAAACSSPASNSTNHPADHTVNKNGVYHKPGLANPTVNCVGCHGSDLRGGTVGISCYKCHGQKW